MGQNEILQLNNELSDYLKKNINQKSFIYAPCVPEKYWANNNTRIAICNLETYCLDEEYFASLKTFQEITEKTYKEYAKEDELNKKLAIDIKYSFFINYCFKETLSGNLKNINYELLKELRKKTKNEKYDDLYLKMKESLYLNFRYSISNKTKADGAYILQN